MPVGRRRYPRTYRMHDQVSPEHMAREALRLDREDRVPDAIVAYGQLLARWPALPDCWYRLAVLQRRAGDFSAALASYQQALDRGVKQPEEVHLNRGVIFADHLRQPDEAERALRAALTCNPAFVPALLNLANLHEDMGRREQAVALYDHILELDPRCFEALARSAYLHRFSGLDDPLLDRLRDVLADPTVGREDRASIGFALGRALDACGEYEAAFAAYTDANRASRESAIPRAARYDRTAEERFVKQLMEVFPAVRASVPPGGRPRPIFVCGMFRSGSTLVEQLLAGHPRVEAAGELDLLPQFVQGALAPFPESLATLAPSRLEAIARRYESALRSMFPRADFVIDKRPDNYLYIGLIKLLFPDARIVHTVRDPLDTCLSIFFLHLDQRMSYALDLMDTGHHYVMYRRLMAHWKRVYGADILDVSYGELVRDSRTAMERLLSFLGLPWDERCLTVPMEGRSIKTASVWQVREPLHSRSVGRASHYQRQLDALRRYLDANEA
jgi:tetratricopeptide (TPR) repeat protein